MFPRGLEKAVKVLEFFGVISKAWKVLKKRLGPRKPLNFI